MTRKIVSLTLAFSGVVLLVSSLVLYIGPPGHVGHFSPWKSLGLSRHHWGAMHLNSGVLFCIAMLVHTWYNWKPLISYMKRRNRQSGNLIPMAVSLALTLFVCTGSFTHAPPMKQVMDFARGLKMGFVEKYGSPPYGTASKLFPARIIAGYMGWDPKTAMSGLDQAHINVDSPAQPLNEIALKNHTTIGHLLDIMNTTKGEDHEKNL